MTGRCPRCGRFVPKPKDGYFDAPADADPNYWCSVECAAGVPRRRRKAVAS